MSTRTGRIVPLPPVRWDDLVTPKNYIGNQRPTPPQQSSLFIEYSLKFWCFLANADKDTSDNDLKNVTYTPSLKTFEEELMEAYDINETRKRKPTYWY